MAYSLRADDIPQSVQLLQLLNIGKVDGTKAEEPVDASDDEGKLQDAALATPKPRNVVPAPPAGINVYTSGQRAGVYAPGPLIADAPESQIGRDTYDRPGDVSFSAPRISRFVAKLGRIQAADRAAQKFQGVGSFRSPQTSGTAENQTRNFVEDGAQFGQPITPGNSLHATPVNPPHAGSRLTRSSSYLSHINPHHQPSVQGQTTTRSTYLDQISPLRFPNLEQPSPLHHRNHPRFNPNHLLQTSSLSAENTEAAMPPRHVPSVGQLFSGRGTTGGQGFQPSNVSSIRRMTSTPALVAPQATPFASGNGPTHMPTHPPAMSHTLTGQAIGGGNVPTHAKTAKYLRRIKKMVLHAVQINRYKNGLFVTSITPRSDLVNDLNVFINSAQVTGLDNLRMVNIKEGIERIYAAIRQGNEVKTICGTELWAVDIEAGWMLSELTDILNSTDKHENARWLQIYGNP